MNTKYKQVIKTMVLGTFVSVLLTGCDDVLDITPQANVSPEEYLYSADQLAAYTIRYYADYESYSENSNDKGGQLPTFGTAGESPLKDDINTDNEAPKTASVQRFLPGARAGSWKVPSGGGNWNFSNIYVWNFYLNTVIPRYHAGEISGTPAHIRHYIGEGYFLRAHEYFYRLRKIGDFPIITKVLPDSKDALVEASQRRPRNEVARFILADLDSALVYLSETAPQGGKTRISKNVALLLKARVALYEGTWLKNHKGTAFVPNGPGWPGAGKEYNKNYQFPSGSIDNEINFFLDKALEASKLVADAVPLANNTGLIAEDFNYAGNPYYDMFATNDPTGIPEVLMARLYVYQVQSHWFNHYRQSGGLLGFTKQFEKAFLMDNGLPYYAAGSGYAGDDLVGDTKTGRDSRWKVFMKAPGEVKKIYETTTLERFDEFPRLMGSNSKLDTSTGYINGKGFTLNFYQTDKGGQDLTAAVLFRATEAYLIYLEACYERHQSLDATAEKYWKALRNRAKVDEDFNKTIAETDMNKEAETDWAAYSQGKLVDATLYNIRRERRCELIGEGQRLNDLLRWRAMDQLNGFQIEGCKIWGAGMKDYYGKLTATQQKALSSKDLSEYLRPYQVITSNNNFFDGLFFAPAHYLDPIAINHFMVSSPDDKTPEESPIYQNPGWPLVSNEAADTTVK